MNTTMLYVNGRRIWLKAEYQPIIHLPENRIFRYETLARFYRSNGELLPTQQMIEEIESCGLINEVTDFIFDVVCRVIRFKKTLLISFNFSPYIFNNIEYLDKLHEICVNYGVNPRSIEIEFSEKITLKQFIEGEAFLRKAKEYGFMISLDDFGAGCLKIDNLALFNFDTIKIDRSIVDGIGTDFTKLEKMQNLLHKLIPLGANIIYEGVEKAADLNKLKRYLPIFIQGYIFYRPLTFQQLKLLENF
ncbi:EAL domain-containing protein [Dickeya undicola]|uniref:EAL domain-containing protein n=1 Tax=Dickeya undicola TaxID=1577887 RepID=A0A3N0GB83_9GAMM|nr:EAL domain-containing protein [Dickeya undicola]RNM09398.1 EAL domain-containing protein [Dickeya undicola]RNM27152.1 EAL domain-containing protein [Dickeya undicola]